MVISVYKTKVEQVIVHSSGWAPLPSGGFVTKLPLIDVETGLFARLDYDEANKVAADLGGYMLTKKQVDEIASIGFFTKPITLVLKKTDFVLMRGKEFCEKHDGKFWSQMEAADPPWDGEQPVQVGKDYVQGAPIGRQFEYGWDVIKGVLNRMIQGPFPGKAHERSYTDYSQLTRVWKLTNLIEEELLPSC